MWYRNSLPINTIAVVITEKTIACLWIAHHTFSDQKIAIRAYSMQPLAAYTSYKELLYNPTALYQNITQFISTHQIKNPTLAFALDTAATQSSYLTSTQHQIPGNPLQLDHHVWETQAQYLYPIDDHQHVFYLHAIARTALLQYTLVALRTRLHLVAITTPSVALIQLYKLLHGRNFRQTTFARDMQEHNNKLADYFTPTQLAKNVAYKATPTPEEAFIIAVGSGLSLIE